MNLLENEISNQDFIQSLIPQRKPIVMLDTFLYYSENKIISGLTISSENIFTCKDRFSAPGLIENMAQTTALHTGYKYYLAQKPAPIGYIGAIKKAEVFELPKIGEQLKTTVEIIHDIMGVTLVEATVVVEGRTVAKSEMKTALAPENA